MFNNIFQRLVIKPSIANRTNLMKNDSKFYLSFINLFLSNEFVSNKNKKILILLKDRLMKAI